MDYRVLRTESKESEESAAVRMRMILARKIMTPWTTPRKTPTAEIKN